MMKKRHILWSTALTLITCFAMNDAAAQLTRVDPPFWWSGMKRDHIELMCYGPQIAEYEVSSDDVSITAVERPENPNYIYVSLDLQGVEAGSIQLDFVKSGTERFVYSYELRQRREGSAARRGFDSSDLIYLIMPDRFANGDPENDSHEETQEAADRSRDNGRHGGDLKGITDKLDYIQSLGATAIWSTPLCEDNDRQGSYHGYAQSDVYRIDPRFGRNEDYLRLAEELHKRDMKLIMDYVTNHWGLEHYIVRDLPSYDWINQFPGYAQTNHRMTTQMDPNVAERDLHYCVNGWFVESMPDLNQQNPHVLTYLIQNAIWWIEYADLDGFRVDTYSYNNKEAITSWTTAVMNEYPNFNIVGEIWMHHQAQIAYWQRRSPIGAIQDFDSQLPSVMDFTLHDAIMEAFALEDPQWNEGMVKIYDNFVSDFLYPDINNILVFAENHDTPRINEIYQDIADYKIIMSLIATVRGIPQIYYGSEIGMRGRKDLGDGDIRRDFPGGWPDDERSAFEAEGRSETEQAYFEFSSKLFNWRKHSKAVHLGKTTQYGPEENVYVYFRSLEGESVMVAINPNNQARNLVLDRYAENLKGYVRAVDVVSGTEFQLEDSIQIPAKQAFILELENE